MEPFFLLVSAWGLRSGGLSVKPRGLEHPLGCAHWRRPSGCKRQLTRSGSLAWMRRFACLLLELWICEHGWQVSSWVRAALEAENYDDEAQEITGILNSQKVKGSALLKLTFERLVDKPYNIVAGPAEVLANRITALSAPPTAASGFQVGASADWKGAWASLGKFVRTTRAPRSSSGSWPTLRQRTLVQAAWGLGGG